MVAYDSEFKTEGYKIYAKNKTEPQPIHLGTIQFYSLIDYTIKIHNKEKLIL